MFIVGKIAHEFYSRTQKYIPLYPGKNINYTDHKKNNKYVHIKKTKIKKRDRIF